MLFGPDTGTRTSQSTTTDKEVAHLAIVWVSSRRLKQAFPDPKTTGRPYGARNKSHVWHYDRGTAGRTSLRVSNLSTSHVR